MDTGRNFIKNRFLFKLKFVVKHYKDLKLHKVKFTV